MKYTDYLKTAHWFKTRKKRLIIDGYKCAVCGSKDHLNVHHFTYRRLGHEWVRIDLITLCEACHHLLHEVKKKVDYKSIKTAKIKLLARWNVKRQIYRLIRKRYNRQLAKKLSKATWKTIKNSRR